LDKRLLKQRSFGSGQAVGCAWAALRGTLH